jgi:hypothetical protein
MLSHFKLPLFASASGNVAQNRILTLNYMLDNEAFCGFVRAEAANSGANRKKWMPDGEVGVSTATARPDLAVRWPRLPQERNDDLSYGREK